MTDLINTLRANKPATVAGSTALVVGFALGAGAAGDTYEPARVAHTPDRIGVLDIPPSGRGFAELGNVEVAPGATITPGVNLRRGLRLAAPQASDGVLLDDVTCTDLADRTWCEVVARNTLNVAQTVVVRARLEAP